MDGLSVASDSALGRVVAASGSQVVMRLERQGVAVDNEKTPALQLAALVKMRTRQSTVFGVVTGLSIPLPRPQPGADELELVELDLIGEVVAPAGDSMRCFQRGVSTFPALGEPVFAATQEDLGLVYAPPNVAASRIGTVHQDRSLPAFVMTDELLGKHFAVLGNTGTGKSCAVALILHAILSQHPNGHVLLLDMHNEYAHAFRDKAEIVNLSTFELPYWLFNFEEMEEIILGRSQDRAELAVMLSELVLAAKQRYAAETQGGSLITVDTPVPYRIGDLERLIDAAAGSLDKKRDAGLYLKLKGRIKAMMTDPRFGFMFPAGVRDNMQKILSQLFRIPVAGKPVTIVDLSSVPSEILNVIVSVLTRMTFDFALWSDRSVPILLVCEEAHRYCSLDTKVGFEPTKRALARCAKEGRKYGVSLCLVSQRPSELAPEVLSQCNTIFALRLSNAADQDFLRGALRESALGLLDFLPALRNAEAVALGEGISVPVRLCFDALPDDSRPLSGTARFSTAWADDVGDGGFLAAIVNRWRRAGR
jgi:hypothetical protein